MITFSQFETDVYALAFSEGRAEFQVPMIRNILVNGVIQLSTYLESLKQSNVSFFGLENTFTDCGLSIIPMCRGQVTAVYSFKPDCRCTRHFFDGSSMEKISCLSEKCKCLSGCTNVPVDTFNPGYCGYEISGELSCAPPYLESQPENDCDFKLSNKYFAIGPQSKLYLFPRIPCGYMTAVHWTGVRRQWLAGDYILDDADIKDAMAIYLQAEYALRVDNDRTRYMDLYAGYRAKASDIIHREDIELRPRVRRMCVQGLDTSELINIYGTNLYPTEVGYCDQKKTEPITPGPTLFHNIEQSFTAQCDPMPLEYWPMNESSGNRVGQINGIVLTPSVSYGSETGRVGTGLRVDAVGNLTTGGQAGLSSTGALSVTGWFKINSLAEVGMSVGTTQIFNWGFSDGYFKLEIYGNNAYHAEMLNIGTFDMAFIDGSPLQVGVWIFFHAKFDPGIGKISLAFNNGNTTVSSATTESFTSASGTFVIASGSVIASNDVLVDEVIVRDYLPDANELLGVWNYGLGAPLILSSTITIDAGTYTSETSQEDADALALAAATEQANAALQCVGPPVDPCISPPPSTIYCLEAAADFNRFEEDGAVATGILVEGPPSVWSEGAPRSGLPYIRLIGGSIEVSPKQSGVVNTTLYDKYTEPFDCMFGTYSEAGSTVTGTPTVQIHVTTAP